jgi:hypothetical protein
LNRILISFFLLRYFPSADERQLELPPDDN